MRKEAAAELYIERMNGKRGEGEREGMKREKEKKGSGEIDKERYWITDRSIDRSID